MDSGSSKATCASQAGDKEHGNGCGRWGKPIVRRKKGGRGYSAEVECIYLDKLTIYGNDNRFLCVRLYLAGRAATVCECHIETQTAVFLTPY